MRYLPIAALSLTAVLMAGCGAVQEVTGAATQTQQCIQAAGIVTDTVQKATGLMENPAELEKALNDGAGKLQNLADSAADTTLKEAADGIAAKLEGLNVKTANDAVGALQTLGDQSVEWVKTLTEACS